MMHSNRFKALEFPQDPTDYEDFEDVAPYNKLVDGKWTSLWKNRHPNAYMIVNRFCSDYNGKLTWRELNAMKERIEKFSKSLYEYQKEVWPRRRELKNLIREQEKLCGKECAEELQKHLEKCTVTPKCSVGIVAYECRYGDNGRCSHYYEIQQFNEELERDEYYEEEDKDRIQDLEIDYERALAVKEDRFQEYLDSICDYFD